MTNREKLKALAAQEPSSAYVSSSKFREENSEWLEDSFKVAILVIRTLKQKNWTQKYLAEQMGVTPQQVTKIISGKENLQIGTIKKLQKALGVVIMKVCDPTSYYIVNVPAGTTSKSFPVKCEKEGTYADVISDIAAQNRYNVANEPSQTALPVI